MAALEVVLTTGVMLPPLILLAYLGMQICRIFFSVLGVMTGSPNM